ncbi:MAG: phosphate signaling complex protein PhoU [Candidatus Zixiibacteriota bacterium]
MSAHLQREIDRLRNKILSLSAFVEEDVRKAARAVTDRDLTLAQQVIDLDNQIDTMEVDIEEDCLKILALHQPVAIDLRYIIAVLKINNDLERIGDIAVNMAERASFLAIKEPMEMPIDFSRMVAIVQGMLRKSIDSLVNSDVVLATEVIKSDDEIDSLNRESYQLIQAKMKSDPARLDSYTQLLALSRHLERIGDHATNIAEDVIYMVEGRIARHRTEPFGGDGGK